MPSSFYFFDLFIFFLITDLIIIFFFIVSLLPSGFIGEAVGLDDVIGGAVILIACLTNEFNLYDKFMARLKQGDSGLKKI